jgi:GNAT superfamily N-acetyltransferase
VRTASIEDAAMVAALIADAFDALPVSQWLVPDDARRTRILRRVFSIHVEHAVTHGLMHVVADRHVPRGLTAAAVWFPDGAGTPPPTGYSERLGQAAGPWVERFRTLDAVMQTGHPNSHHHHLAFLAVDPTRQGEGLGSALLAHHHAVLDETHVPAYLEASSQHSRDLYTRRGYRPHGAPLSFPGGPDTGMWPMWREPKPTLNPLDADRANGSYDADAGGRD